MNRIITIIALAAMVTACEHRDFCYDHADHAPTYDMDIAADYDCYWQISPDGSHNWEADFPNNLPFTYADLIPGEPQGLRVLVYPEAGRQALYNVDPHGGTVRLARGKNNLLLYNNDTEYIVYDYTDDYEAAVATTRTRTRSTYYGNPFYAAPDGKETTVTAPDMLYGNFATGVEIERSTEHPVYHVTMHPLVYTYVVNYHCTEGREHIVSAHGSIAGLSKGVSLCTGHTLPQAVTVLYDCQLTTDGIVAQVRSFGAPDYPNPDYKTRGDGAYALNVEVLLKNGEYRNYYFDITDQMKHQPQGGVIDVTFKVEPMKPADSGFEVTVDEWNDFQNVDIIF